MESIVELHSVDQIYSATCVLPTAKVLKVKIDTGGIRDMNRLRTAVLA